MSEQSNGAMNQATKRMGPFLTIWVGQIFSLLGSELVQFSLAWYLTTRTGSATVLATATLAGFLPAVILGPFAGALIDRWNRRLTMIAADLTVAAATAVLVILFALGVEQIWHIYLIMLIRSVAGTFHRPAMSASTSLMVPDKHLTRVAGFNQMLNGGLSIIAAPLGAGLLEIMPVQGVLMIDIVTALIAVSPLLFIHIPQPVRSAMSAARTGVTGLLHDMGDGLRYVRASTGMLMLLIMAALINMLLNPAFSLLPLLVKQHFGLGALQFGWMQSAFGVGVIAGGVTLGVWGGFKRKIYTSLMGLIGIGLSTLLIGAAPANLFILGLAGSALVGLSMPFANGALMAIFQSTVAPEMQGRVFTLIGTIAAGLGPIGLILAGPVADTFGPQSWFLLGGAACLLMGLISASLRPVRNLEEEARRVAEAHTSRAAEAEDKAALDGGIVEIAAAQTSESVA